MAAFIVTTFCSREGHIRVLQECLNRIQAHYPEKHVYVLNDHSPLDISSVCRRDNVSHFLTAFKGAGELNPYIFSLSSKCKHDKLIYIHDSVMVQRRYDFDEAGSKEDIVIFWYSKKSLFENVFTTSNGQILENLKIGASLRKLHDVLRTYEREPGNLVVSFGAMGVFSKQFAEKLLEQSTLLDVAPLFTTRLHRCLFERILSVMILEIGGDRPIPYLCGNIQLHPGSFVNTNPDVVYDCPLVKVWQGR